MGCSRAWGGWRWSRGAWAGPPSCSGKTRWTQHSRNINHKIMQLDAQHLYKSPFPSSLTEWFPYSLTHVDLMMTHHLNPTSKFRYHIDRFKFNRFFVDWTLEHFVFDQPLFPTRVGRQWTWHSRPGLLPRSSTSNKIARTVLPQN